MEGPAVLEVGSGSRFFTRLLPGRLYADFAVFTYQHLTGISDSKLYVVPRPHQDPRCTQPLGCYKAKIILEISARNNDISALYPRTDFDRGLALE